jgi:hypothetical protein
MSECPNKTKSQLIKQAPVHGNLYFLAPACVVLVAAVPEGLTESILAVKLLPSMNLVCHVGILGASGAGDK